MDKLDAIAAFAAVCDASGFAPAARRLGLSPSVVTRLVAGLEEQLGVRLLHRTTRSLHLTEAGARYLDRVRLLLADLKEADEIARSDRAAPKGRLVVTAPVIFGRLHVAPLLRRYMGLYPEVSVELHLNDRNLPLIEEGIDVAIRIGAPQDSTLVTRKLGETSRVTVASPAYLTRCGRPEHPGDLASHATISFQPLHAGREWIFVDRSRRDAVREFSVTVAPRFATNSGDAAIAFAREGGGVTRALLYQVLPSIEAGELVTVLDDFEPDPSPIHAVFASARLLPARVRGFLDLAAADGCWRFVRPA